MRAMIEVGASVPVLLAYLDPGTGSLVFQLLIAGLLSSMLVVKSWTLSLKRLLGRLPRHG
jgi:hypothetical protein